MTMVKTSGQAMEEQDHYYASIDFSNACREFYMDRQRVTKSFKEEMGKQKTEEKKDKPKCFMDSAMDKLRREMAGLMDQDLSLMKQLLTLNETIEEIKFKRRHGGAKDLGASSCEISDISTTHVSSSISLPGIVISKCDSNTTTDFSAPQPQHPVNSSLLHANWKSCDLSAQYGQVFASDSGYDETYSTEESGSDEETTV
ncbi:uncharacterized protein LOC110466625 [Mizuhopecten yessoensis]|uniref:Uncharacterized protein n=1 Tax=Mizuhopecten yessoensis TaxID=6573 RepID=A0A210PNQ2_MIZYE|nr:uncharacterized protein LOC110466625 [Mizuhopecten yessoensis]OWF38135.1 hypothetical protein KP79_PYT08836 [Mizuhopecten yessoensis]